MSVKNGRIGVIGGCSNELRSIANRGPLAEFTLERSEGLRVTIRCHAERSEASVVCIPFGPNEYLEVVLRGKVAAMRIRKLKPVHPGEMLLEEFMKPLGLSISELARGIGVPPNRVSQLVHGRRAITADTALRLERHLRWPARIWMEIQAEFDLELSRRRRIARAIQPHPGIPARGQRPRATRSA